MTREEQLYLAQHAATTSQVSRYNRAKQNKSQPIATYIGRNEKSGDRVFNDAAGGIIQTKYNSNAVISKNEAAPAILPTNISGGVGWSDTRPV
jgi:hypothetical protein